MVNVPPLLCSTPPPIDFGEDDDDSGLQSTINLDDDGDEYPDDDDFGLVTTRSAVPETGLNATKESQSAEPQPVSVAISAAYSERPPDLELIENCEISKPTAEEIKKTVEAFNYQVKQSPSLESYDSYQETPPPLADELEEVDADEEDMEININDNVPSLKLDSLSLYSTESVSASSTLSPVADADEEMPPPPLPPTTTITKAPPPVLSHQVTLEDVSDDSDEECSPKKPKELFIREGAEDFFAIEVLATPTATATSPVTFTQSSSSSSKFDKPAADTDLFQFAASFEETTEESVVLEQPQEIPPAASDDEFDDFGDFADFSAVPTPSVEAMPPPVQQRKESQEAAALATAADDGFDDFQEFATPPEDNADNDDDDDDFGDFSEPLTAPIPAAVAVPPPPPPAAVQRSIDERIKPVLELMFPLPKESSDPSEAKRRPLAQCQNFNFSVIEQAQALDYQWTSSEMRHSLVRALGIDSRNILFGDKWNASMPRFAANLSFDPLKPLKPLEATPVNSNQQSVGGLEATGAAAAAATTAAAAAAQASQIEARSGPSNGENCVAASSSEASNFEQDNNISADINSDCFESTAAAPAAVAAATAATLSTALSANGYGHNLNGSEQLHQQQQQQPHQQQFDLRATPTPSPSPPPVSVAVAVTAPAAAAQEEIKASSSTTASTPTGFAMPLKETHIYTPSKSDTAVARTTTLAPIDFDYETAATGIIIDETVVKKEYRDVEYKPPPFGLDSPSRLASSSSNGTSSFELPPSTVNPMTEDDDFSDFQSMPARTQAALQPPRNGTPTFGEQMILCPAILLPQAIPLAKTTIEWGDNALSSINAEEMARIEDLFSAQSKPPTISATVAKQPPQQQQQQQQEDDEWSDFVSVPVPQQQQQQQSFSNNNNVNSLKKPPSGTGSGPGSKEDDWSDFVSSTPLPTRPQFNSGAWQSANFYNNPLSLYRHQKQPHAHSNLVPKYQQSNSSTTTTNHNNNNNNNNSVPGTPQQIHIMHDFSTAPSTTAGSSLVAGATYQQHHQRQQFQIGNAKVAPRISLIPDLSFVAPALPTNAGAFMGSLPKPSFGGKK